MPCIKYWSMFSCSRHGKDWIVNFSLFYETSFIILNKCPTDITREYIALKEAGKVKWENYYCCIQQFHSTTSYAASYKRINTQVVRIPGEDKFVFMCQSEGFPLAEVFWQNENVNLSGPANTTYTLTADGLYNVTSILIFKPNMSENYTCVFWNKELNGETSAHISTLGLYDLELVHDSVHTQIMRYGPSLEFSSRNWCNIDSWEMEQISIIYVFEVSASFHSKKSVCIFSIYFNFRVAFIIFPPMQQENFQLHEYLPS